MVKRTVIPPSNKPAKTSEAPDVAARYLLYKLYDASKGTSPAPSWQSVRSLGEPAALYRSAYRRGWVVLRDDDSDTGKARAKTKDLWAALTEEGRAVARKGLR
jgi:hypothetical protein